MQKILIDFVLKPLVGAVVGTLASAGMDAVIEAVRNRKKSQEEQVDVR